MSRFRGAVLHRRTRKSTPAESFGPWMSAFIIVLFATLSSAAMAQASLPTFEQVRGSHISSDAILLDRHGVPLADVRLNPSVRRLDWVPLAELSPAMRDALLAAEDRRFFEHTGVDWMAFVAAAWQNLWQRTKRGASTLTMQLAGMLDPALRGPGRRNLSQKWDQGRTALELERHWTKGQILEAYLNLAPFRGDLEGVEAASQVLFGLPTLALSLREASILAALLRGPNARPEIVAQRACLLVGRLGKPRLCNQIRELAEERLDRARNKPRFSLAPHLATQLLHHPGQKLTTSVDAQLQRQLVSLIERVKSPSAALLLDNATGEVLAWVGGTDPAQPDGIKARRLLPDWWWPHLAALALDQRRFTAASPLFFPNSPTQWVSLRTALAQKNPAAMRYVLTHMSREAVTEFLRSVGAEPPSSLESILAPMETSVAQVAAAWRTYVAGGTFLPPRLLPADTGMRKVVLSESAFLLLDMTGDTANSTAWQATWTSTAPDTRESVIVGSTSRYTLAIAAKASPSLPSAWRAIAHEISGQSVPPVPPEGVSSAVVSYDPPDEPARREWFLHGTEVDHITTNLNGRRGRIVFPAAAQRYAVSADASGIEMWVLTAQTTTALKWVLDGRPLGEGTRIGWLPQQGRHRLSIFDVNDELIDSIDFEVGDNPAKVALH